MASSITPAASCATGPRDGGSSSTPASAATTRAASPTSCPPLPERREGADMAPDAQLQQYLRPGERLLWCGRSLPREWYHTVSVARSVYGVIWIGAVLYLP